MEFWNSHRCEFFNYGEDPSECVGVEVGGPWWYVLWVVVCRFVSCDVGVYRLCGNIICYL